MKVKSVFLLLLILLVLHCCLAKKGGKGGSKKGKKKSGQCGMGDKKKMCEKVGQLMKDIKKLEESGGSGGGQSPGTPCAPNPCQNGGTCIVRCGEAECRCKPGFALPRCAPLTFDLDSVILKDHPDYSTLLVEFLQEKEARQSNWERCYRASESGYSAKTFHDNCDNKGPTITVVRVGDYVFGGYVSRSWTSDEDNVESEKAVLFSLNNFLDDPFDAIIHGGTYTNLMFRHSDFGPTFGGPGGGTHDLYISDKCNVNEDSSSTLLHNFGPTINYIFQSKEYLKTVMAGTNKFKCSEYEVFYRESVIPV